MNDKNHGNLLLLVGLTMATTIILSWALLSLTNGKIIQEAMATTTTTTTANTTLGDPFYVEQTKSTGIRVIDIIHGPKVEVSFAGNGTMNSTINVTNIGTIWTIPTNSSGNSLYSEGQGILTTQKGEMATYTQQAVGQITPEGKVVFHGSMFFKTLSSTTGELAFLNNEMGIYDYESDIAGNAVRQVWEWK
jgi:hypothetical protein